MRIVVKGDTINASGKQKPSQSVTRCHVAKTATQNCRLLMDKSRCFYEKNQ